MIFFLNSSNQVEKCCKGQPISFGLSVCYFTQKNSDTPLQVHKTFVTDVADMSVLHCQFPLWPDWKQSLSHSFPAYQTARRLFYYGVPVRCRNLQFSFLTINEQCVNIMTCGKKSARNLIKQSQIIRCLYVLQGQVFVLGGWGDYYKKLSIEISICVAFPYPSLLISKLCGSAILNWQTMLKRAFKENVKKKWNNWQTT